MRLLVAYLLCATAFLQTGRSQSLCNPISRFDCGDGVCISIAKKCNGYSDCKGGQDEIGCDDEPARRTIDCKERNMTVANMNNYICRRDSCDRESFQPCPRVRESSKRQCVCDDECGTVCANPHSRCKEAPPNVPHAEVIVKRMRPETLTLEEVRSGPPYRFHDVAVYTCEVGRELVGPQPRCDSKRNWSQEIPRCVDTVCRGPVPVVPGSDSYKFGKPSRDKRILVASTELAVFNYTVEYVCREGLLRKGNPPWCNRRLQWTEHTVKCVVPCFETRDPDLIQTYGLRCGTDCLMDSDCPSGMTCHCDGPCARVCVNPNTACRNATDVPNASLSYIGQGVKQIARYQCQEGFYLSSGRLSLECSGSGTWIGELPVCQPIKCGDPGKSIRVSNGEIFNKEGLNFGDRVEFYCASNYNLRGSRERQCMGNGRWSGRLTVCDPDDDNSEDEPRCPHPGSPINGRLIGDDFRVGAIVGFECDKGYVMYGTPVQECLWFKEWNGTATPTCENPDYPHSASDVIGSLTRTLENLPDSESNLGRSIAKEDIGRAHEIYFVVDVSESVIKKHQDLKNEMEFAKRLVQRMKRFGGNINYGIMLFASENVTVLDIADGQIQADKVIKELDQVYLQAADGNYKRDTRSGTATAKALERLQGRMGFMRRNQQSETMRHVFLFTDGRHTEGKDPIKVKDDIEQEHGEFVEFYSITACRACDSEVQSELKGLSTGDNGQNYIYIEDFYQLQHYLDRVTNVTLDFSKCGQAGEVGSLKGQASLGRSVGGANAAENAWPWQALITRKSNSMKQSLSRTFLLGGGSILNEKWILTAAHVLIPVSKPKKDVVVFVGIFERPAGDEKVLKTVEAYSIGEYIEHSAITEGWDATKGYDIALIKLGNKQDEGLTNIEGETNGLTFGYYIRPVCLPCTGTCITKKILSDHKVAVNDGMGFDEKCLAEENLLLRGDAKVVSTGFGHLNKTVHKIDTRNFNPPKKLQQVLLRIAPKDTCLQGVTNINQQLERDGDDIRAEFNDSMICCVSGVQNEVIDTCKGDSGGPVVREVVDDETGESCWVQVGIVSWGYRCGQGYPSYYVNVAKFIPWINKTIGGNLPGR